MPSLPLLSPLSSLLRPLTPDPYPPIPDHMLSVVIPVFNEAESLATLHRELSEVAAAQGYDLDVVLVDDGSTDGSWEAIRRLAEPPTRV